MAKQVEFRLQRDLERWLVDRPVSRARVIAARAALRVLPLIGAPDVQLDRQRTLCLAVFRANWISLALAGKPADDVKSNASAYAAASDAYVYADAAVSVYAAAHAASVIHAAAATVNAAAYAADAADAAAAAAGRAAADFWRAVSWDAQVLSNYSETPSREAALHLARQPLWPMGAPDNIVQAWEQLKALPAMIDGDFGPWIHWYEAAAPFAVGQAPTDYFGDAVTQWLLEKSDDWWKRGSRVVNADIAEWLPYVATPDLPPDNGVTAYEQLAQSEAPAETIAAYRFDWNAAAGQITTAPPDAVPRHGDMAQDLLDGLRRKAMALAEKLRQSNADPAPGQSLAELLEILPEKIADLRPGLLLVHSCTLESMADAFAIANAELELFPGAIAGIIDTAKTAQKLQDCFPEIRDIERERRARKVQEVGVENVAQAAAGLAGAAAEQSTVVDDKARAALNRMAATVKNATDEKLREDLAGHAVLVQQNFLSTLLRSAVVGAVKGAVKSVAGAVAGDVSEVTSKARDGAKLTVIAGLAGLVGTLHPVLAPIFMLAAMGKSEVVVKAAEELLQSELKKLKDASAPPTDEPPTDEPPTDEPPPEEPTAE